MKNNIAIVCPIDSGVKKEDYTDANMKRFVYILPLLLVMLLFSSKPVFAAGWTWDATEQDIHNNGLTSFTFTWDNKDTRDGGGSLTFCQSGYAASDGLQFYSDFSHDEIDDLSTGNQLYINDASLIMSGSNTISVDCVSGHVVVNGKTISTNAISNAGTFNSISWSDNSVSGSIFDPTYTGNYYVSSPVTVGTPAPSPTPSPTPASGSPIFQDSFTDPDGTTLQQHNSKWVDLFGNDITIQSNKAATSGQIAAYFLNGFSSQGGNQCVSSKVEAGGVTINGNVGFGINMNSNVTAGYFGAIRRNSDNTLTWNIYSLGPSQQIFVRKTPSQTYDWTQPHMLQFCDLNHVVFLIVDGQTLYTTSDLNLFTSGDPLIDIDPSTTIDDLVYSTGITTGNANQAPVLGTVTVSPSPARINTTTNVNTPFTDADASDTHTATINWGDGAATQSATVSENNGSGTIMKTHTYTALGSYTITVTVNDSAGNKSTKQLVISVAPTGGFQGGNIKDANYTGADLSGQNISGGNAKGTNFSGSNLSNTNLSNTNLKGANFTNANLTGANLTGANVNGAIWSNTICPNGTNSNSHNNTCAGQGGGL